MITKKNLLTFFLASTISAVAIFIFFAASMPRALAYEISSTTATGSSYNFGGSLQNLISPFSGFINSLKWTNNTPVGLNVAGTPLPSLNIASGLENMIRGWFSEFNDWVYRSTGIQLSGIIFTILNIISWTLHAAEDLVNWLLGLFH